MADIYQNELRARFGPDVELGGEVPDDRWMRQVLMRRTHRRYSHQPVPEPLVRLLLAAAFSASSKSDFQQASVIWVQDRARRDRLAALIPDMPWIGTAPVFLVFVGDARRLEQLGEMRGHKQPNGALEGFFNAAVDAADRRRDARHSIKDRQRAPERFGMTEFYGWSEDKARQQMTPEGVGFATWLRARGFTFADPETPAR